MIFQIFAQLSVVQPFSACSEILFSHHVHSRIGIIRRGDCMFIEKARYLEKSQAIGGIVIDHNISLKSSNGAIFSMTGDGNNNVNIPLVLMFKDEAFHLLHLLSKQPKLIIFIGDEKYLKESFYQQIDYLESLFKPITKRWIYGESKLFKQCSIISNKLKQLELSIQRQVEHNQTSMKS